MADDSNETPLEQPAGGSIEGNEASEETLQDEQGAQETELPKQVTEMPADMLAGDAESMDIMEMETQPPPTTADNFSVDAATPETEENELSITTNPHESGADVTEGPSEEREETAAITGTLEDIGEDEQQVPTEPQWESKAPTRLPRSTKVEQDLQQIGQKAQESDQKNLRDKESLADQESQNIQAGAEMSQEETGSLEAPITASSASAKEESLVSSATPGLLFEEDEHIKTHPISLSWAFGYNSHLPVYSLLDEENRVILYVSSHTAVIHDILRNRQYHLQGHSNSISCLCVSEDRRWIATADQGPDNLIIVWDAFSGIPVHTIFDSHPEDGVGAIAISQDAKYLVTLGAGKVQRVCIWKWTSPEEKPMWSVELQPAFGYQNYIVFNPKNHKELVSNSKTQVLFYLWDSSGLQYSAPHLTDRTFNKTVGFFSQSVFHFGNLQALTATSGGKLVVWDAVCPPSMPASLCVKPQNRKAIKLMYVQKDALTVLTASDSYFVTCDVKGHIKFYDGQLQLVNWYSHFKLGPIQSISFSKNPPSPASNNSDYSSSCTINGQPFIIRNFILSTLDATVLHVTAEGTKLDKLMEEAKEAVNAIACHPSQHLIAIGSHCGLLKVWDFVQTKYLISRIFMGASIQCLSYDPEGSFLAAGFTDGSVYILDSISLENDCKELKYSKGPVTQISFSHDSQYLATADEKYSVTVYKRILKNGERSWEHLAGLHSHYKPIRNIIFGVLLDSDQPRLLSLGEDRLLVEYDLGSSSKEYLAVLRRDRIEQRAVPMCLAWYPPFTPEAFILTANNQYKMKLYNATTKMCRKTLLGPTYGSPLEKIQILPAANSQDPQKRYLAYITKDKVGLQILPIDGNPHKSSAFICHPGGVSNLASSYDGCHVFTAGGNDCIVMKWEINVNALEAAVSLGGEDLIPFYNLLDGGRDGEFFRELEDYFYYAQLRSQGIDAMETRQVSTHIPLEEVPFVMRAMGFYPSEEKIEDMINEVKFSEYVHTGKQVTNINLGDFIKLYINHRPAFGLSMKEIQNAFQVLGYGTENGEIVINKGDLLQQLQCRGEHMTEEELAECLTTLLGMNPEGGRSELGICDHSGAAALMEEEIPEEITAEIFTADILGLPTPESDETETEKNYELTSSIESAES
ncbi:cilia- and flagella-associated protein 251 isoform X1 [Chelonia mydas]|uniref:cilia- and flagella-associated protein 251 isoform X1 n=1 Tax=Chelonia mydas TaxID=8469 RepID=UPI0018A2175D|nr:cilia- and flagella-associated protein 251 isoform X1 [Chelonia mydas]XP_043385174.1 cilia- and flagella-associated protein 251 isoform X1 [Chelonia mydas]XP_043385175.1 cilia- and flagella-associated protein 251 isoform X1 [Chelonia mydas]